MNIEKRLAFTKAHANWPNEQQSRVFFTDKIKFEFFGNERIIPKSGTASGMQHSLFPAHVYPASNFPARIFLGRECSPFPVQLSDVPTQSTQTWTLNKADTNERHPFHMVAQPVILFSPSPQKKLPSLTLCECGYHFFTVTSKIGYDHRTEPTQN